MQIAIVSDIHGNLGAFEKVLQDIDGHGGAEEVWCLGDLVGYGPAPNECIELLQRRKHLCVLGNHDLAAVGGLDLSEFNEDAAEAILWTRQQLKEMNARYLKGLPFTITRGEFTLVHGSPRNPIWEYLLSPEAALLSFALLQTPYCLVGHSHVPVVFEYDQAFGECEILDYPEHSSLLLHERRLILNPGSVGQPRDGDPRAAYLLYDVEAGTVRLCRVAYDIGRTQRQMAEQGLPDRLIERLDFGW